MDLRIRTLGALAVVRDGRELTELLPQRLRLALLIYLAHEGGARRDALLTMFWPDRDPARARHALRQMLYELRQAVGDPLDVGRREVRLHAVVDALEFERAPDSRAALTLYRGPFLQHLTIDNAAFDNWADSRRAHYARMHRKLRRAAVESALAANDATEAVRLAHEWVEVDPLEDEAAHEYVRALVLAGRRSDALVFFDAWEKRLRAELQVEPLDDTRELVQRVRAGERLAIVPRMQSVPEVRSDAAVEAAQVVEPAATVARTRGVGRRIVAVAAMLAILTIVAFAARGRDEREVTKPGVRLVVTPFVARDAGSQLVADAMTEQIALALSRSQALDVVSPQGVAMLRDRGLPEDTLRRRLASDYMVGGSVTTDGRWLRVAVELLDGRTGSIIRSETLERPLADSRQLPDDAIERVVRLLRREVGAHVDVRWSRQQTNSELAWRQTQEAAALQGQLARLIRERDLAAIERDVQRADSLLASAARLDRDWAEPVIRRGWLYERRAFVLRAAAPGDSAGRRGLLESALRMSDIAAEREKGSAGALELRGAVLLQMARLPNTSADSLAARIVDAERSLRAATTLDPSAGSAWARLAELLNSDRRYADAKNAAERAYRLDPWSPEANVIVNLLFTTSLEIGEDDEAERWCTEGRRNFEHELPFLYCLLALHAWSNSVAPQPELLRAELDRFHAAHMRLQPSLLARFETMIACAHARRGEHAQAKQILADRAHAADDPALLWMSAAAWAAVGDTGRAVELLREYAAREPANARRVASQRAFHPLRGQRFFEDFLAALAAP